MEIVKRIVAPGHGNFVKPNPIYFAVHSTANPGATAENHVNYWSRPSSQGGGQDYAVHLVSDWKTAYQCVDFNKICWQVGNGNKTCIGLEICEATNKNDFERGLSIARDVILQTLNQFGWSIKGAVRSHKWFTENYGGSDHIDPIPYFLKWGWTWDKFVNYLEEGDNMPSAKEIADAVWGKNIQNPTSGALQPASDYLRWGAANSTVIKKEILRDDDPTGREVMLKDHDHIKYIAKAISEQTELLKEMSEAISSLKDSLSE